MKKSILAVLIAVSIAVSYVGIVINSKTPAIADCDAENIVVSETAESTSPVISLTYTAFNTPNIDSSFKTYMDYRTITNKESNQYKLIQSYGWCDENGFMRTSGEKDLGIAEDYYMIALGSYYGKHIGTKYKITTDTGKIFYGILSDQKADKDTNSTKQYSIYNNDVIEFIVDVKRLNKNVKIMGSANVYMPLNGKITKIERIDFLKEGS